MRVLKVKIETYVPKDYVDKLREALNSVGACRVGDYDNVMTEIDVRGYWRPLEGSNPFDGKIGEINSGCECKLELRCGAKYIKDAISAIKACHPYEEPVINIVPLLNDVFDVE